MRGLLRRSAWARQPPLPAPPARAPTKPSVLTFGGNTLDLGALELRVGDASYHLTVMEAELLRYLLENAGKVVSRKAILEDVWNLHEDTDTRAIDNFIVRLRRYLNEQPEQAAARPDGARRGLQVHRRAPRASPGKKRRAGS